MVAMLAMANIGEDMDLLTESVEKLDLAPPPAPAGEHTAAPAGTRASPWLPEKVGCSSVYVTGWAAPQPERLHLLEETRVCSPGERWCFPCDCGDMRERYR